MSEKERFYGEDDGIVSGQVRDFTRRYGILRPRLSEEKYQELAGAVDEETAILSGGFDRTCSYLDLLTRGPRVVPFLIKDLEKESGWWRVQMITFFASEVFHQPVDFPEEIRGYLDLVTERVQEWWEHTGQAYYESLEPTLRAGEIPPLS